MSSVSFPGIFLFTIGTLARKVASFLMAVERCELGLPLSSHATAVPLLHRAAFGRLLLLVSDVPLRLALSAIGIDRWSEDCVF
jgi:hypothetical protein